MSKPTKINRKIILFCALGMLIPLALIWLNMIAIDHDAANKREYDEMIRKQQALVKRDQPASGVTTTDQANASATAQTQP